MTPDVPPSPPARRQVELFVPGELWTVNDERSKHWSTRAARTAQWRTDAAWCVLEAKLPKFDRVTVEVFPFQRPGGVLADVAAHLPPAKAAIDALVDAGVLVDDTPEHVEALTFRPPLRADARGEGLRVVLVGVPA